MAWNAPSDKNPNPSDPWTGKPKKKPTDDNNGPPSLEEAFKKFSERFLSFSKQPQKKMSVTLSVQQIVIFCALVVFLGWGIAGVRFVKPTQEALVFQLGVYQENLETGWHWRPWLVDRLIVVDRQTQHTETTSADIITKDHSLAHIELRLQYHVSNAKDYYFHLKATPGLLSSLAAGVLQQTAGESSLEDFFSSAQVQSLTQLLQQRVSDRAVAQQLGIQVSSIEVVAISVPDAIKETFSKIDSLMAIQDKDRQDAVDNEATMLSAAQLKTARLIAAARLQKTQLLSRAKEEVAGFLAILPSYEQAPALIRYRLYTEAMQEILSKVTPIIVDGKSAGVTVNVPASGSNNGNEDTSAYGASDVPVGTVDTAPSEEDVPDDGNQNTMNTTDMYSSIKGGY